MNRLLKLFTYTVILIITALFLSCSHNFSIPNETVLVKGKTSDSTYITLKVDVDSCRTVLPDADLSQFTNFILKGTKQGESEQTLGSWDSLNLMQNATIAASTGSWTFTLTAKQNGSTFSGTVQKEITTGKNSLSFTLSLTDVGTGKGSFSITVDFSSAENATSVTKVIETLENLDGTAVSGFNAQTLTPSENTVTFTQNNITAGTYRAKIIFYNTQNGTDVELATYRELVEVSTGLTSSANRTLESFYELYTITYNLNGGSLPAGTTLIETISKKSAFTLPALTRDYYTFAGWYTDENCTDGHEITQIHSNTASNVTVWAKFTPINYTITYVINGGTNEENAITSYTIEDNVTLPTPEKENNAFGGWYLTEDFSEQLNDWNSGNKHEDITLYAKWLLCVSATNSDILNVIKSQTENCLVNASGVFYSVYDIVNGLKALNKNSPDVLITLNLKNVTGLETIGKNDQTSFKNCSNLEGIILPDSLTSIKDYAFYNCSELKNVTIGENVTSIGEFAFHGCKKITSLTIPNSVTSIGEFAFYGCKKITSLTIPDSVTSIGTGAFCWCSGLTSLTIGNGITSIGVSMFADCKSLVSITIPDNVISIERQAFIDCEKLTNITIPDSVISIGNGAFQLCSELTSVTIGNGVSSIGKSAFSECGKLKNLTFNDTTSIWYYTNKEDYTDGTEIGPINNAETNATYMKNTGKYYYLYNSNYNSN